MPHTVESTISLSERDLARGAIDMTPGNDLPVNTTLLETAVSIVKEAGPKIVEVISGHLRPVLPQFPEVFVNPRSGSTPGTHQVFNDSVRVSPPQLYPESRILPGVMVSSPVETVVIIPPQLNISHPLVPVSQETVIFIIIIFLRF
jgi:hypothetical protein